MVQEDPEATCSISAAGFHPTFMGQNPTNCSPQIQILRGAEKRHASTTVTNNDQEQHVVSITAKRRGQTHSARARG